MKISPLLLNNYTASSSSKSKVLQEVINNNTIAKNFSTVPLNAHKAITFGFLGDNVDIPYIYRKNKEADISKYFSLYLNLENTLKLGKHEYAKFTGTNVSLQKFAHEIKDILRYTTYSSGGITIKEVISLLKGIKLDDEKTLLNKLMKEKIYYPETVIQALKLRREFIKELILELSKKDPKSTFLIEHEGSDFMVEVAQNIYKKHDKDFNEYNKRIKEKLAYEAKTDIHKLDLVSEIKKLPPGVQNKIEKNFHGNYRKMLELFVAEGCMETRAPIEYSVGVDTALMQMLPRYTQKHKDETFKIAPLSRRLSINEYDDFMKQFKVGSIYSYPKTQSCSKSMRGAEHWFQDHQRSKNIVFRIHPKAKTTKAFDIQGIDANKVTNYQNSYDDMCPRFFNSEVLYPPNAKFKVLGKTVCITNNYTNGSSAGDYIKTIIDLQEI